MGHACPCSYKVSQLVTSPPPLEALLDMSSFPQEEGFISPAIGGQRRWPALYRSGVATVWLRPKAELG